MMIPSYPTTPVNSRRGFTLLAGVLVVLLRHDQLVLDREHTGHLASPHFRYLPIAFVVDDAEQRGVSVPHDDMDRIHAERLMHAGESSRVVDLSANLIRPTRRVTREERVGVNPI